MGSCRHLLDVMVLALITRGTLIAGSSEPDLSVQVHGNGRVYLHCNLGKDKALDWSKDGRRIDGESGSQLLVGLAPDDPRGLYQCNSTEKNASLQLYFRMCQNCIQLSFATVLGLVLANIVVTAFLAGAVWFLAQEPSRLSPRGPPGYLGLLQGLGPASDKQALLAHEQLYQPLGERSNGQYSHIGVAKARRR